MRNIICNDRAYTPTKIVCVGKNYPDHINEMGGGGRPPEPAIFLKPNSAMSSGDYEIQIPKSLGLLHYEVELCFFAGKTCKDADVKNASSFIQAYAVGLDLTLRERQSEAKKVGASWALAKGFDNSAVFGGFVEASSMPGTCSLDIALKLNGQIRQQSNTREMIFTPADILSFVSHFMTIEEGDVFMCGTPSGVGEIKDGDVITAELSGCPPIEVRISRNG